MDAVKFEFLSSEGHKTRSYPAVGENVFASEYDDESNKLIGVCWEGIIYPRYVPGDGRFKVGLIKSHAYCQNEQPSTEDYLRGHSEPWDSKDIKIDRGLVFPTFEGLREYYDSIDSDKKW